MASSSPLSATPLETWKPWPGAPAQHEVSDLGRVRSLLDNHRRPRPVPKLLAQSLTKDGRYLRVNLQIDRKNVSKKVHQLVLETFVGPSGGMEGCHGDNDTHNNVLTNLRWGSHASNMQDKVDHGTNNEGSKRPNAKLVEADIPLIRTQLAAGATAASIGRAYGVSRQNIADIRDGKAWRHV